MRRSAFRAIIFVIPATFALAPLSPLHAQRSSGFELSGILSASLYTQDALFAPGNGQRALRVSEEVHGWFHGADVRSTRLTASFGGPRVFGRWSAGGTAEIDFFGPAAGGPPFGDEQPLPRLRLAYVDLTNGPTRLRVGQDWSLTWGAVPVSTVHIGFAPGWGSGGVIGWRFPGVFLRQRIGEGDASNGLELELALLQGSWSDAEGDAPGAGHAGSPQVEARLNLRGGPPAGRRVRGTPTRWSAYLVGHFDRKDLRGVTARDLPRPPSETLDSWAAQVGGRIEHGSLTVQGNAYRGRAMGHHFAHVIQPGDIRGHGAWTQIGIGFSPRWSLWLLGGFDDPDDADVISALEGPERALALRSRNVLPMLRYRSGPYSVGLEWLHNRTEVVQFGTRHGEEEDFHSTERSGNQIAIGVRYDF